MSRSVVVAALMALGLFAPPIAEAADELSTSNRLDDRRYVTSGPRAYDAGTEAGRYPAMGFHTRGEMGGIWTRRSSSSTASGSASATLDRPGDALHQRLRPRPHALPGRGGLSVERTDFVPGEARGVLVGLSLRGKGGRTVHLRMQTPLRADVDLPVGRDEPLRPADLQPARHGRRRGPLAPVHRAGQPPADDAEAHDWAAAVGSRLGRPRARTGAAFRGPQDPPLICPASGPGTPPTPSAAATTPSTARARAAS